MPMNRHRLRPATDVVPPADAAVTIAAAAALPMDGLRADDRVPTRLGFRRQDRHEQHRDHSEDHFHSSSLHDFRDSHRIPLHVAATIITNGSNAIVISVRIITTAAAVDSQSIIFSRLLHGFR